MRTLDDVYGSDRDSFPLEQEARPPRQPLHWDEEEAAASLFLDSLFRAHWGLLAPDL